MAKKEREKPNDKAWMDTYSDMVTLLMCFFVLLFSMSSLDASKWKIIVKGFNPEAESTSQVVLIPDENAPEPNAAMSDGGDSLTSDSGGTTLGSDSASSSEMEIESIEDLFEVMASYVAENQLQEDIKLFQGEDYTYIMFSNNVFFDGDSSVLRREGKDVLDTFAEVLGEVSDKISKIQVMGHTNQADPNKPNNVETDRFLSSNRAVEVLVYLQEKNVVAPSILESIGYGQHYPIGSFSDPEGRAKNRRVEIVIAEEPAADVSLDEIYGEIQAAQASGEITEEIVDPSLTNYSK